MKAEDDQDEMVAYVGRVTGESGDFTVADLCRASVKLDMPLRPLARDLKDLGVISMDMDDLFGRGFDVRVAGRLLRLPGLAMEERS